MAGLFRPLGYTVIVKKKEPRWKQRPGFYAEVPVHGRRKAVYNGDGQTGDPNEYVVEDMGAEDTFSGHAIFIPGCGDVYREELAELVERARERPPMENPDPDGKILNQKFRDHLEAMRMAGRGHVLGTSIINPWTGETLCKR